MISCLLPCKRVFLPPVPILVLGQHPRSLHYPLGDSCPHGSIPYQRCMRPWRWLISSRPSNPGLLQLPLIAPCWVGHKASCHVFLGPALYTVKSDSKDDQREYLYTWKGVAGYGSEEPHFPFCFGKQREADYSICMSFTWLNSLSKELFILPGPGHSPSWLSPGRVLLATDIPSGLWSNFNSIA